MPGIADKQIVHDMGTTYYKQLIQGGVKIYEYEPGFVHSKVFICDDTYATVGTINLDYRSLYLHFENGTLLYKSKKIMDVKQNFFDTLEHCKKNSSRRYPCEYCERFIFKYYSYILTIIIEKMQG